MSAPTSPPTSDWRHLCAGASAVLDRDPGSVAHRRGAAFVARQAIERGVRSSVDARVGDRATWSTRFLVLDTTNPDANAPVGRVLWLRWSSICHYSVYDLIPLADEVQRMINETEAWLDGLAGSLSDAERAQ